MITITKPLQLNSVEEIYAFRDECERINREYLKVHKQTINLLFNKGRYVEGGGLSHKEMRYLTLLTGVKFQFNCIVIGIRKMTELYKALGLMGIKVNTTVDWI